MHKKNHFVFLILTSNRIAWMSEDISNFVNLRDSKYEYTGGFFESSEQILGTSRFFWVGIAQSESHSLIKKM